MEQSIKSVLGKQTLAQQQQQLTGLQVTLHLLQLLFTICVATEC